MLKEFKDFVMRGNVLDMAIGIIIGAAFGAIITSAVRDVIMHPIGLLLGRVDFANLFVLLKPGKTAPPYASLDDAQTAGAVTVNYGIFINAIISFLIVALVVFLIVRTVNRARRQLEAQKETVAAAPATKECPYCLSKIPLNAKRCAYCTSQL